MSNQLVENDKLFIPDSSGVAWIPTGIDNIFKMSEGYKKAAELIYKEIVKKDSFIHNQFLACTMVFCFRQYIELRLKELLFYGKKELFVTPTFTMTHNINRLFLSFLYNVLGKINPNYEKKLIRAVFNIIKEFNDIDENSMNFRYPIDKTYNASLTILNFDVRNFKRVMDKVAIFFDTQLEEVLLLCEYNKEMELQIINNIRSSYDI